MYFILLFNSENEDFLILNPNLYIHLNRQEETPKENIFLGNRHFRLLFVNCIRRTYPELSL